METCSQTFFETAPSDRKSPRLAEELGTITAFDTYRVRLGVRDGIRNWVATAT